METDDHPLRQIPDRAHLQGVLSATGVVDENRIDLVGDNAPGDIKAPGGRGIHRLFLDAKRRSSMEDCGQGQKTRSGQMAETSHSQGTKLAPAQLRFP